MKSSTYRRTKASINVIWDVPVPGEASDIDARCGSIRQAIFRPRGDTGRWGPYETKGPATFNEVNRALVREFSFLRVYRITGAKSEIYSCASPGARSQIAILIPASWYCPLSFRHHRTSPTATVGKLLPSVARFYRCRPVSPWMLSPTSSCAPFSENVQSVRSARYESSVGFQLQISPSVVRTGTGIQRDGKEWKTSLVPLLARARVAVCSNPTDMPTIGVAPLTSCLRYPSDTPPQHSSPVQDSRRWDRNSIQYP